MTELSTTDLARVRTAMAADRTLMAWVRTALSMISFGFTITKFFQYLNDSTQHAARPQGARNLGLTLTAVGVIGLLAAVLQHQHTLTGLGVANARARRSAAVITAIAVILVGVVVFVSVLTRLGPF